MIYNKNIILIPARLNSTRLKEKLLLKINQKSIINLTYENALKSRLSSKVIILVDSLKLLNHCLTFTDNVFLTKKNHKSGTERIIEFINSNESYENIVNVQGDEPFLDYRIIDGIFKKLENKNEIVSAFFKKKILKNDPNEVKVVKDLNNNSIYFSRSLIPNYLDLNKTPLNYNIHIGVYGYKTKILKNYNRLKIGELEKIEKLEQLRFIENDFKINLIESTEKSIGIDTINDFKEAVKYFNKIKS